MNLAQHLSPGGTTKFARADGQWAVPPGTAASGALVQLAQIVTASSQATVDFTSISGAYNALKILWQAKDTTNGTTAVGMNLIVNNDTTSAHYSKTGRHGAQFDAAFSSSASPSAAGAQIGIIPEDGSGNAGFNATGEITLIAYANASWNKKVNAFGACEDATNNITLANFSFTWKSNTAISRLTFTTDGTAFKDGSVFTLYGVL